MTSVLSCSEEWGLIPDISYTISPLRGLSSSPGIRWLFLPSRYLLTQPSRILWGNDHHIMTVHMNPPKLSWSRLCFWNSLCGVLCSSSQNEQCPTSMDHLHATRYAPRRLNYTSVGLCGIHITFSVRVSDCRVEVYIVSNHRETSLTFGDDVCDRGIWALPTEIKFPIGKERKRSRFLPGSWPITGMLWILSGGSSPDSIFKWLSLVEFNLQRHLVFRTSTSFSRGSIFDHCMKSETI